MSNTKNRTTEPSKKESFECPFERDGVVEGIRKLTKDEGLMHQLVEQVRRSNKLAEHNNKWLRVVAYLFALAVLLLLVVGLLAWEIFGDVVTVEHSLSEAVTDVKQVVRDQKNLLQQQKKTDDKVDELKDDQDEKSKVELVPEDDPEKAKDHPIKVRIITPKRPEESDGGVPPTTTQTAVEVPLPVKDVKKVDIEK